MAQTLPGVWGYRAHSRAFAGVWETHPLLQLPRLMQVLSNRVQRRISDDIISGDLVLHRQLHSSGGDNLYYDEGKVL